MNFGPPSRHQPNMVATVPPMELPIARANLFDAPFPHLRAHDFLNTGDLERLQAEFPAPEELRRFQTVMGGRRRLASDELTFYDFLETRPAWRALYDAFNSEAFVTALLSRYEAPMRAYGGRLRMPIQFDPTKFLRLAEDRHRHRGLSGRVRRRVEHAVARARARVPGLGDRVYVHFDISSAQDGYWREVHCDLPDRVAACLIYFSGADECGGAGGEFALHRLKRARPLWEHPRQPPEDCVELVERVRPEKNMFLSFLSTRNSYHSVPKIVGAVAPRNFIYVGITVERDTIWTAPPSVAGQR